MTAFLALWTAETFTFSGRKRGTQLHSPLKLFSMNQKQREFLIEAIDKQYKKEKDALDDTQPQAPSLNNYLTAAILDGSFVMKSPDTVREAIRQRVRDLGKGETLVTDDGYSRRHRHLEDDETDAITVPALLLFDEPPEYAAARKTYESKHQEWEKSEERLDAAHNAMKIKIQIGSDKALENLVDQADTLCSLSLTESSHLLLTAPKA